MFMLFLILAVFQHYGASMPIITHIIDAREALQSGPVIVQGPKIRTHFDIVWSCVSTLFICTWVAIHPNIPPQGEGPTRSLWRRIRLMLWTLLVPELILIWAYKQWSAARYIAEYFKDEDWTPIHGHFLIMGGFIYVDGERELVLDFNEFQKLLGLPFRPSYNRWAAMNPAEHPQISFPTITAAEICDKARGDFLSKTIAILQSLWFMLQCIARGKQGLALTELELVTLALASLNGVMYFFWWDKPLGVNEPIKLYREGHEPPKKFIGEEGSTHDRREQRIDNSDSTSNRSLIDIVFRLFKDSRTILSSCCASSFRQLSSIFVVDIGNFLNIQRNKLPNDIPGVDYLWFLYLLIHWFIWIPFRALTVALFAIAGTENFDPRSYVPMFYVPTPSLDTGILLFIVLPLAATVFGALHCIGWNFHFPTHLEQLLWRIGSLAITLLPAIPLPPFTVMYINYIIRNLCGISIFDAISPLIPEAAVDILVLIVAFFAGASLVAYMATRLLLRHAGHCVAEETARKCILCYQLGNFLSSHMIALLSHIGSLFIPYIPLTERHYIKINYFM